MFKVSALIQRRQRLADDVATDQWRHSQRDVIVPYHTLIRRPRRRQQTVTLA